MSFPKCTSNGFVQSFFVELEVPGLVGVPGVSGLFGPPSIGKVCGGPMGAEILSFPLLRFECDAAFRRLPALGRRADGGARSTMDEVASVLAKGDRKSIVFRNELAVPGRDGGRWGREKLCPKDSSEPKLSLSPFFHFFADFSASFCLFLLVVSLDSQCQG